MGTVTRGVAGGRGSLLFGCLADSGRGRGSGAILRSTATVLGRVGGCRGGWGVKKVVSDVWRGRACSPPASRGALNMSCGERGERGRLGVPTPSPKYPCANVRAATRGGVGGRGFTRAILASSSGSARRSWRAGVGGRVGVREGVREGVRLGVCAWGVRPGVCGWDRCERGAPFVPVGGREGVVEDITVSPSCDLRGVDWDMERIWGDRAGAKEEDGKVTVCDIAASPSGVVGGAGACVVDGAVEGGGGSGGAGGKNDAGMDGAGMDGGCDGSSAEVDKPSPECRFRSRPSLPSLLRLPPTRVSSSSTGCRRVAVGMRLRCTWAASTERRERVRAATGVVGERDMFGGGENKSVALRWNGG
jgi:hypothetical protein